MDCPVCKNQIEDDERVDVLSPEVNSVNTEGEVTFVKKNTLVKKRGFGADSYMPVMVGAEVCPYCGVMFVPRIAQALESGIVLTRLHDEKVDKDPTVPKELQPGENKTDEKPKK